MKPEYETEVRIVYHRVGFESKAGHQVRTKMEASICDWLMSRRIAHRHGSEIFTVRFGATRTPTVYVPDIVLHDKDKAGKTVLIESYDAVSPRVGGSRIIAAFRREMQKEYSVVIVAKKGQRKKILKEACDLLVDFENLDQLEKNLPLPPRS